MFEEMQPGSRDASRLARLWIVGSKTRPLGGGFSSIRDCHLHHPTSSYIIQIQKYWASIPVWWDSRHLFKCFQKHHYIDTNHHFLIFVADYIFTSLHGKMNIGIYTMMILKTFEHMIVCVCNIYSIIIHIQSYTYMHLHLCVHMQIDQCCLAVPRRSSRRPSKHLDVQLLWRHDIWTTWAFPRRSRQPTAGDDGWSP